MTASDGAAPDGGRPREFRLVSATYHDKTYSDCLLLVDEARSIIELAQRGGKKRNEQATLARFRLEPTIEIRVDGPKLGLSELSMVFASPSVAGEVADILRRPSRGREALQTVSEAESAVAEFLASRQEAVAFLSRMKANPREALLGAESMWAANAENEPIDAVYSSYSVRLAEALKKMTSALADVEKKLGPGVAERLYALAYTLGAVQGAPLEDNFKPDQMLAALQELGIAATAQDLLAERPAERLLPRAHPALAAALTP